MTEPTSRAGAGRCPGSVSGRHDWLEVTTLNEAGDAERYVCSRCPAQAEELTAQGAERQAKAPQA